MRAIKASRVTLCRRLLHVIAIDFRDFQHRRHLRQMLCIFFAQADKNALLQKAGANSFQTRFAPLRHFDNTPPIKLTGLTETSRQLTRQAGGKTR